MTLCSKCGKKLKFLSTKHVYKDGTVLCSSCFEELRSEQYEKNKKIMADYISKYLSNKDTELSGIILYLNQNKDINRLIDLYYLTRIKNYYQSSLQNIKISNNRNLSSQEILDMTILFENILDFLNDLEKMYKLFKKKNIDTNYVEILSFFANIIENNTNKKYDELLDPFYIKISEEFGNNINKERLIKEFLYEYLETDSYKNLIYEMVSRLLYKFNINFEEEELNEIIETTREEIDLEKFERDLGSSQKARIVDWDELTGHEFEDYLKDIFKLLGYSVTKTPLSGDQGADLILLKNCTKTVVQAKKYSRKVSNKAVQEIVAAINYYKADKAIVVTNSSFTKSAIDLALSNKVELWDGKKLINIIKEINSRTNNELSSEINIDPQDYINFAEQIGFFLNNLENRKNNAKSNKNILKLLDDITEEINTLVINGLEILPRAKEIGFDTISLYDMLKVLVEPTLVGSLHSTIFSSLKESFNNKGVIKITKEEQEEFNKFYKKIEEYLGNNNFIGINKYRQLKEKIKQLDESNKIKNFYKIFIGLENFMDYNKKINIVKNLYKKLEKAKSEFLD